MLIIVELVLLVLGIMAIIKKKWSLGKGREVIGGQAQILGAIACSVLPLAFGVGFIAGIILVASGGKDFPIWLGAVLELGVLLVVGIALTILGNKFYKAQEALRAQQGAMQPPAAGEFQVPPPGPPQ